MGAYNTNANPGDFEEFPAYLALPLLSNYALVWAGPASSIIFVGCLVYSIAREKLFDIRIIIHRSMVYALLSIISGAYSAIEFGLTDMMHFHFSSIAFAFAPHIGQWVYVSGMRLETYTFGGLFIYPKHTGKEPKFRACGLAFSRIAKLLAGGFRKLNFAKRKQKINSIQKIKRIKIFVLFGK